MGLLKIGGLSADEGEKKQGYVDILNTHAKLPVTLINGQKPGKTVLITAGVHGGEYPCIQTAIELAQELEPNQISGRIILVHPVNTSAFEAICPAVVPEDGKNINRVFPGKEDGTLAEQIAFVLTRDFQSQADFYLDLHAGDIHEGLTPFVFYPGNAEEAVTAESRHAASILNMKYMLRSTATTGGYNSAALHGLPSILLERGGCALWSREEVSAYKKDVKNVLRHLQVLPGAVELPRKVPIDITKAIYLRADSTGCWYPEVHAGDKVAVGQKLGEIRDFFGNILDTYYSEINGVILYLTVSLSIRKDRSLIAYGELTKQY